MITCSRSLVGHTRHTVANERFCLRRRHTVPAGSSAALEEIGDAIAELGYTIAEIVEHVSSR